MPPPARAINIVCELGYDGEIMVAAGDIPYTAGREAIRTYNESYAGNPCMFLVDANRRQP